MVSIFFSIFPYITPILFYDDTPASLGLSCYIGVVYWENGKENGNYFGLLGLHIGIMEKKMETTIVYWGLFGVLVWGHVQVIPVAICQACGLPKFP